MLTLFFFAFVSILVVLALSLDEINPFQPEPLPMLQQIELCAARDGRGVHDRNELPVAA